MWRRRLDFEDGVSDHVGLSPAFGEVVLEIGA